MLYQLGAKCCGFLLSTSSAIFCISSGIRILDGQSVRQGMSAHFRHRPAHSHVQFAQGPMVFSQEKVIVLSESRMNLRPVWAAASLAAAAGDGEELFLQDGQHLVKVGQRDFRPHLLAEGLVRLFRGADADQGAGYRTTRS